jgi:ABC-type multidrug transport system ATPase subunit
MHAIRVSHVSRRFRDGGIFDLDFDVQRGERIALFGPQAAGKSTLLALLGGRLEPDEGEIELLSVGSADPGSRAGLALQSDSMRHGSSPRHLLTSALSSAHVPLSQRPARLAEALDVSGLYSRADRPVRELSYTAVHCLRIALAIVSRPEIILVDDLLRLMSPDQQNHWLDFLDHRRHVDGATVVHATTDSRQAETADRVLLLDRGRMIGLDTPGSLIEKCAGQEIVVEAMDVDRVHRTLRGIAQVEAVSSHDGVRFYTADGAAVAAHLFRHPLPGLRSVFVRRPDLWDCLAEMSRGVDYKGSKAGR